MSNARKIRSKRQKKKLANRSARHGGRARKVKGCNSFTTTPAKIAMEHQAEVRDLVAQGLAAAVTRAQGAGQ